MLREDVWADIITSIRKGDYDAVMLTPPCNTFSRLAWANRRGPQPLRSRTHPLGYPWLEGWKVDKVVAASEFIYKTWEAARTAHEIGVPYLIEHPEDLGVTSRGGNPASMRQLEGTRRLQIDTCATTCATHQCNSFTYNAPPDYAVADYAKPTRWLGTLPGLKRANAQGWPTFDDLDDYTGPLPRFCGHRHTTTLVKAPTSGPGFPSSEASAYPPAICFWIARMVIEAYTTTLSPATPAAGVSDNNTLPGRAPTPSSSTTATASPPAGLTTTTPSRCTRPDPDLGDKDTSDESEDGYTRPKLGAGNVGFGPPLEVKWAGKRKPLHDGLGLCSPGRWLPSRRPKNRWPGFQRLRNDLFRLFTEAHGRLHTLVFKLANGLFETCPFADKTIAAARGIIIEALLEKRPDGCREDLLKVEENQPFYLGLLAALARGGGDPDYMIAEESTHSFTTGVPIGVGHRLPRTPAVFERRRKWRNLDETPFIRDFANYRSAEDVLNTLEAQFEEEEKLGMRFKALETDLKKEYPGDLLRIAGLGAIQKGDSTFRIIHDGTHGVRVNNETQPRDQIRMPSPAEERRLMQHASSLGAVHFALQADVRKAHRRFFNRRSDWGMQTCRIRSPHLWVNRVGTFGVGTACYWWARLAAIVGRVGWMFFDRQELWELLFADDIKLTATGPTLYDDITLKLFLWVLVGTPISWKKCRGGLTMDWIGYWLDYGTYSIGLSESRAMWLIKWATELIDRGATVVRQFLEGLGRLSFATGVLEWDRPFLGILYAWGASVPPGAFLKLPAAATLTLEYIRERLISGKRTTPCRTPTGSLGEVFARSSAATRRPPTTTPSSEAGGAEAASRPARPDGSRSRSTGTWRRPSSSGRPARGWSLRGSSSLPSCA